MKRVDNRQYKLTSIRPKRFSKSKFRVKKVRKRRSIS